MIVVVSCKKCKHRMKYQPLKPITSKSRKQCVYCGYSIIVKDNIRG